MKALLAVFLLATVLLPTPRAQQAASRFDAAVISFPRQSAIHSLADLDGDGIQDGLGWWRLEPADPDVKLEAFRGQGDGTFEPLWSMTVPWTYQGSLTDVAWAMEVGSFDANDRDDFVVTFDEHVWVYTSSPSGPPVLFWERDPADQRIVSSVVVADFDADGADDLALALENNGVQVFRNTGTGFSLITTFPVGQSLAAAEIDGLPGLDLVARTGNFIRLLSVTSTSVTLHDSVSVPFPESQPMSAVPGDIDGDGDEDIVVFAEVLEDYVVLRQGPPGVFVLESIRAGGPATALVDIDGDGDLDGLCCGGGSCPCPSINDIVSTYRISLNDGTGKFATGWKVRGHGALRLAGADDVDGDGDVDLVAGRAIYFNRGFGVGEPQPAVLLSLGNWLNTRFGDLDGDGDLDSFLYYLADGKLNDGTGGISTVATPVRPPLPDNGTWLSPYYMGDFDGDGDLDQIGRVIDSFTSGTKMLWNTGGGEYVDGGWVTDQGVTMGTAGGLVADLDDDGDQDLVASGGGSGTLLFWINDGSGQFSLGSVETGLNPLVALDFDGDGLVDILDQRATVLFGTGGGLFDSVIELQQSSPPSSGIAVGDLDENGFPDVVTERGNLIVVWWNQGGRVFIEEEIYVGMLGRYKDAMVSDVDADGHLDLIVNNKDRKHARILRGDGAGQFTFDVDLAIEARAVEDLDGDGDDDVLSSGSLGFMARSVRPATQGGVRRQFGISTAGTGGMTAKLGASGPFRVGEAAEVRLVGARGATFAVILVSAEQSLVTYNWPSVGLVGYTAPGAVVYPVLLDGSAVVPGSGRVVVPFVVPPLFQGLTFILQGYVQDKGVPKWLTQTNGLQLHFD